MQIFLGGCKHALAFLKWVFRKSDNPSPTEVECYWKKPLMKNVGTTKKFIEVSELCNNRKSPVDPNLPDNLKTTAFFNKIVERANAQQTDSQISRHLFELKNRELYSASIHQLILEFQKSGKTSAEEFIRFSISKMTVEICKAVEVKTRDQKDNLLWHELRYARITASNLHEATRCKTTDGSLIFRLLGASKKFDSREMERGRDLEKSVLQEVQKKIQKKIDSSGLVLMQQYPVLGASPDGRGDDFVVEVKCPSKDKTVKNYLSDGQITPKYQAQIQLQMFATGTKKGLFCVADPEFEKNKKCTLVWIDYDKRYLDAALKNVLNFWKRNVFVKIMKSVA